MCRLRSDSTNAGGVGDSKSSGAASFLSSDSMVAKATGSNIRVVAVLDIHILGLRQQP